MNRRTRQLAAILWAGLLLASLGPRVGRLMPSRFYGSPAVLDSGDPELDRAMHGLAATLPAASSVLLVARAPAGERAYVAYRAAYDLVPARVLVVFRDEAVGRRTLLTGDVAGAVHDFPISVAAGWERVPGLTRQRIVSNTPTRVALETGSRVPPRTDDRPPVHWIRWMITVILLAGAVRLGWARFGGAPLNERVMIGAADRIGIAMAGMAILLALAAALSPQSAWSNWDAWAVWDIKVKAILSTGWIPTGFLVDPSFQFAHPEYPLAWPWLQAVFASAAGGFDPRIVRLTSVLVAALMPPLLASLLLELGVTRGRWLVAGAVALLPAALEQSANGYVDWPLATVETAVLVLLLRAFRGAVAPWTVGWLAGVAANMKQEGLVFGIAVLVALVSLVRRHRLPWRGVAWATGWFLLLAMPWRIFAGIMHLVPGDFGFDPVRLLTTVPVRVGLVLRAICLEAFGPGLGGASFVSGLPVPWREWTEHCLRGWLLFWFAAAWIVIRRWRDVRVPGRRELAMVLGFQVAAAFAAYGATILDPRWLLAASLDRLMLQWVPVVTVLAASLVLADHPRRV